MTGLPDSWTLQSPAAAVSAAKGEARIASGDATTTKASEATEVAELYNAPLSLIVAVIAAVGSSALFALASGSRLLMGLCAALVLVGMARIASVTVRRQVTFYQASSWLYAITLGAFAAVAMLTPMDGGWHPLIAANCFGYVAVVSARAIGRPAVAMAQMLIVMAPLILLSAFRGTTPSILLAITALMFMAAMMSVRINAHTMYAASRRQADANGALAQRMQDQARQMSALATTDSATGLTNRAGIDAWFAEVSSDSRATFALFWFDLDRFKEVNDTLGHPTGDYLLREIAQRLRAVSPADALVARFGGDEFVVACPGMKRTDAARFGKMLQTIVAQPVRMDSHVLSPSASLGIAMYPDDGATLAELMAGSDLALYASKSAGRGQSFFYDTAMSETKARQRLIADALRTAVASHQIDVHFQPIISLDTGRITSLEALARWSHPELGEVDPAEFIAIAEKTGLIVPLANHILLASFRAAQSWPDDVRLAVNAAPAQVHAADGAILIQSALKSSGFPHDRLDVEITERSLSDPAGYQAAAIFMKTLNQSGVRVTLDNFGSGFSSLARLRDVDFQQIKIDAAFLRRSDNVQRSEAMVRAITSFAASIGLPIVAEEVETADEASRLLRLGFTHAQGFRFSPPVPASGVAALLREHAPRSFAMA